LLTRIWATRAERPESCAPSGWSRIITGTSGTATGFEFYPQGTTAGLTKYSGSAIVTTFAPSADRDDAVLFSSAMQLTGTVTVGTA
jgi:hypothetical protein